jgi:hypothetical protein
MSQKKSFRKKIKPLYPDEELLLPESNEYFSFIAGYTDSGVPFGLTWDEYTPEPPSLDSSFQKKPGNKKTK